MDSNECFVCGENCITEDHGDGGMEIGSAVHFSAKGNWASSVWDPLDESLALHDEWEPKRTNRNWSWRCSCGGEMLVEKVGMDSLPICAQCRRRGPKIVRGDSKQGNKK